MFGGIAFIIVGMIMLAFSIYRFVKHPPKDDDATGGLLFIFAIGAAFFITGGEQIDNHFFPQLESTPTEQTER